MLVVTPFESGGDPERLSRLILDEKIEFATCTPSEYSLLLAYAPDRLQRCLDWRFAGAGGEVLPERLVDGLRKLKLLNLMLTNRYGPIEATLITSRDIPIRNGASTGHDQSTNKIGPFLGHVIQTTQFTSPAMTGVCCLSACQRKYASLASRLTTAILTKE